MDKNDKMIINAPIKDIDDHYYTNWDKWKTFIRAANGHIVTLQYSCHGSDSKIWWNVITSTGVTNPFDVSERNWVPEPWLTPASLSNTLANASVVKYSDSPVKKECGCSARDLFTVGHKCGRLAPIDKR